MRYEHPMALWYWDGLFPKSSPPGAVGARTSHPDQIANARIPCHLARVTPVRCTNGVGSVKWSVSSVYTSRTWTILNHFNCRFLDLGWLGEIRMDFRQRNVENMDYIDMDFIEFRHRTNGLRWIEHDLNINNSNHWGLNHENCGSFRGFDDQTLLI